MKKKLYGNYLGIVITGAEHDPEFRGRCQIFFPGISNTLYKKINKNLKDLSFGHIDPSVFTPDIIKDLREVLPWAECAAPIVGTATSAYHNENTGTTALTQNATVNPNEVVGGSSTDIPKPDPATSKDSVDELPPQNFQSIQSGSSNNKLAEDRQKYFFNELSKDPSLVNFLYERARNEVGTDPRNQQTWMETVANRAMFGGMSLEKVVQKEFIPIQNGGYYPTSSFKKFGPPNEGFQNSFNEVFVKGSNITNLATDNASNQAGNPVADRRIAAGVTGNWYKNGQIVAQGTRGAEFLYRSDAAKTYRTASGIKASEYAKNNNIEISPMNPELASANPEPIDGAVPPPNRFGNNGPKPIGLFSCPAMGAKLWAFFYGGEIQRPVYFACVQDSWNIYNQNASDGTKNSSPSLDINTPSSEYSDFTNSTGLIVNGGGFDIGKKTSTKKGELPIHSSSAEFFNSAGARVSLLDNNIGLTVDNNIAGVSVQHDTVSLYNPSSILLTAPNIILNGNVQNNSGLNQKDQKKTEEYLAKEQAAADQIAKQTANDIAQGGEEINCPLCEQKLADDRSDFVTKILRTIQKYSNILPWDCWNWGVTKFLINFIVMPMLNEISALAVSGGEGCGMCDKGKVKSYSQAIENANKKAAETFAQKQNEINESAKDFKPGSNVTNVTGSAGINAGFQHVNNAPCSKELKDDCSCIPTGMKKGTGAKRDPLHQIGEKVPTVVYIVPNKTSAGDITFQSANDIRMTAGSPGIKMETNGKISITGGFLDLNSMDGPAVLTSKNVTNVNGAKVHITGAKGVAITAPSTSVNGNLAVTGNLGVKGSITLDGALSVKHLKIKTMRSETTSNSSPKSTSNATTYYTGGAAGINIFDKIKNVLVRDNPLKMLMLTPKGLLTIFQEVYDRILLMIGIHPVPTGFFVGYGSGVVYNFTSNSSKVPDDHSHQFDAPQMTRAADNAAWVNMADDPSSEAPNPAPSQGDDPVGGPHSLAGCGGGGFGFGGNSNASRRRSARNSRYGVPRNSLNYGNITPQGYFNGVTITTNNTILSGLSGGFITTTTDLSGNIITINNSITGNGLDIIYDFNPNSQKWEYDANGEIKPRDLVRFSISEDCL